MTTIQPYGSWKSPITAALVANQSIRLQEIHLDAGDIYCVETRPAEGGRYAIVRCAADSEPTDVPGSEGFSARSLIYGYGGGSFAVSHGTVYFTNYVNGVENPDQRLYRLGPDGLSESITPDTGGNASYGDLLVDSLRARLICVQQDGRTKNAHGQPVISLVSVGLTQLGSPQPLVQGSDFYSSPCLSPDGTQLAWLTWNYPEMPWDGTELWVADIAADGSLIGPRRIAGGRSESIFQPQWSPDGTLYFVSDRSGWWSLYRIAAGGIEAACLLDGAEMGAPQWVLGMSTYAFLSETEIIAGLCHNGSWNLATLDAASGSCVPLNLEEITDVSQVRAGGRAVCFLGGGPSMLRAVLRFDPASATVTAIRTCGSLPAGVEEALSLPRAITYPTTGSSVAHAFYYPPRNTARAAPEGSRPPLLVFSHGGPTSATTSVLNLQIQFFTSRGFAVVDVNYRGSSGFGRPYREALNEEWGIVDADDCANAARYLVMRGLADERRIGARGGSAGGYVTLCLAAYYDLLCVGASYYGVSDLLGLAESTHNLELRYLDRLVGPLPEAANAYRKRSPLHNATSVRCPLIFFQGRQDRAVPTEQTLMMVEALQRNRVPCVFTVYPGEQHGFRIAANIQDSLESELAFYALFMHFTPAATEGASD